jgi:hypothetical protein
VTLLLAAGPWAHAQQLADAQAKLKKITGPWLWMIAPAGAGQGGQASTDIDMLDKASGGKVTEAMVAKNGAKEGDAVGQFKWTLSEIAEVGGDNVNPVANKLGAAGNVEDHSSYALITLTADKDQPGVLATVGSDDSIKVWLNGEMIWKNAVNRAAGNFQDLFPASVKKGDNLLLVKVGERGGGWSMFVGIDADFKAAGKNYKSENLGAPPEICFETPKDKIEGPWLWMVAPTLPGQGGRDSTNVDSLSEASNGKVTESQIAKEGPKEGSTVGKYKWAALKIPPTGGDNINPIANTIGAPGNVEDHSAYAWINVVSGSDQKVCMAVGSDDSVKVWLNGKVIWANPVNRGAGDFQDRYVVNLKKGNNSLLVKVSERGGGWSMFVGLDAKGLEYNLKQVQLSVDPRGKLTTTWGGVKGN